MSKINTLTSLAMLKVNIDQGQDYLSNLRPFVLQVLVDQRPSPITDKIIKEHLSFTFGLEIPSRTIQVVLRRLVRNGILLRQVGIYQIKGELPDPGISARKADADRHISSIIAGLIKFSKSTTFPIADKEIAIDALCIFLSEFSIPCLRAFLLGTAIPTHEKGIQSHQVLVSHYVLHLQETDPDRFDSFVILLKGHMLANAFMAPDLQNSSTTFKKTTFYFDTPFLVQLIGLEGKYKQQAAEELITLLIHLGAHLAVFSHTLNEISTVVKGAASFINAKEGRGAIIREARRTGKTKSDLLLIAMKIDELLCEKDIKVVPTPRYINEFQIDESLFGKILDDEVLYYNPRAREYDINSVRSIYVKRNGYSPRNLEDSKAVLVTNNSGFAKTAYDYEQEHEAKGEVSSVITDFSLANIAWLKAPLGAASLPVKELLSFAYAALEPSDSMWRKYMTEINKLEKKGSITNRDVQLLRSSVQAQDELMRLTLGDDEALTGETIHETLTRITEEIKSEERATYHRIQEKLQETTTKKEMLQKRTYWRCKRNSKICTWPVTILISITLLSAVILSLVGVFYNLSLNWWSFILLGVLVITTLANLLWGANVKKIHTNMKEKCLQHFLKKEEKMLGIKLWQSE